MSNYLGNRDINFPDIVIPEYAQGASSGGLPWKGTVFQIALQSARLRGRLREFHAFVDFGRGFAVDITVFQRVHYFYYYFWVIPVLEYLRF